MGDRVSISFKHGTEESVTLFNHWGGMTFVADAQRYADALPRGKRFRPLDLLEPGTVMVDFIRLITKDLDCVGSSLYLCATPNDGDNSDNGHHVIDLKD